MNKKGGNSWQKSLINELLSKGYVFNGSTLERPKTPQIAPKKKNKKIERTFDTLDVKNIERNEQKHPFKTYLQNELNINVWIEYEFTAERKFRIDFAIPKHKIAIEIDGGIFMRGRSGHSSGTGIKRDQEKTTLLSVYGWRVMRITPDEQFKTKTLETIKRMIKGG